MFVASSSSCGVSFVFFMRVSIDLLSVMVCSYTFDVYWYNIFFVWVVCYF